jgi:hypothetical protein
MQNLALTPPAPMFPRFILANKMYGVPTVASRKGLTPHLKNLTLSLRLRVDFSSSPTGGEVHRATPLCPKRSRIRSIAADANIACGIADNRGLNLSPCGRESDFDELGFAPTSLSTCSALLAKPKHQKSPVRGSVPGTSGTNKGIITP